jgi:hypothetical protein
VDARGLEGFSQAHRRQHGEQSARSLAYELEFHWGYDPRTQGAGST